MMAASGEPRRVYAKVDRRAEFCDLGEKHEVEVYAVKLITPTGEMRPYDNGYEVRDYPLFTDAQGRIYHAHLEIDFHASTYYVRDGDKKHFVSRPRKPARDTMGRLL